MRDFGCAPIHFGIVGLKQRAIRLSAGWHRGASYRDSEASQGCQEPKHIIDYNSRLRAMTPEHLIHALVSRGVVSLFNLCAGLEHRINDGRVVSS